ncbi:hypothetical protein SAMN05216259_108245 [Actinacidiphila guanduensis]|uniref:Uncharacterized protein n=1 Tax=Actinacidiphila guanduensis TaxID=310781 RepID=A0A1H0HX77_9ACTN|nr:hypothetical protein SAMN05216259_108245 [Actinacidiphila guanduensis]
MRRGGTKLRPPRAARVRQGAVGLPDDPSSTDRLVYARKEGGFAVSWDAQGAAGSSGGYGGGSGGPGGYGAPGGHGGGAGAYGPPGSQGGYGNYGGYGGGGYGGPVPPPPSVPPKLPADPLRAVAVGLLNLSGLGIGYALVRRWFAMGVCWVATAVLLVVALPADPDGVSTGVVVAYLVFLVLAALHGAFRGLRTRLSLLPLAPVAAVLGLVLLAVPAGGVALYDGARDDATQKMLLDRLAKADTLVATAKAKSFAGGEPEYKEALSAYRDLKDHHPGSKAAKLVPDRMKAYYEAIATPYDQRQYCDAVTPLTYLRNVPARFGKGLDTRLAASPDDKLATSLYECGVKDLDGNGATATGGDESDLGELLTTFPNSPQAAKVEPAVSSSITKAAKGIKGSDPCAANDSVRGLGSYADRLAGKADGDTATALGKDGDRADGYLESGTYACGVHQYKAGDFGTAVDTMNGFVGTYPHAKNRALAKKIVIAAEVAQSDAAAGKHLPTLASGGSLSLTVSNDSPDSVEILYTGTVTGSFTLPACGKCSEYSSESLATASACKDSGKHYPKKTVHLPPGTIYLLHKPTGGSTATSSADSEKLRSGNYYTDCAYTVQTLAGF